MADINSLTANDIQKWFEQATPDQATRALHTVLDKVATYPQQDRDRIVQQMGEPARKLFQGQPVS